MYWNRHDLPVAVSDDGCALCMSSEGPGSPGGVDICSGVVVACVAAAGGYDAAGST
jgi:hypothetical protein